MVHSPRRKPAARPARQQRRPQARSIATRERLLRAAEQLFARRGYDTSSLAEVAERAGVGVSTLYHHFPEKRALLLALIDEWSARELARGRVDLDAVRANVSDLRSAIHGYLASRYRTMREDGGLPLLLRSLAEHDHEVRSRLERVDHVVAERVRDLISYGQAEGAVRPEVDPIPAALLIRHAVRGAATETLVNRLPEADPERVLEALTDMIFRYLVEKKTQ